MKITVVNRYFFPDQSATSRVTSSIAFALAKRGFDVSALTSRELHNDPGTALQGNETVNGVQIKRLASLKFGRRTLIRRAMDSVLFHWSAFIWLLGHATSDDIVIVCTDPPLLSITSSLALRLKGATMVNWIMDLFPETAVELGFFRRWPWLRKPLVIARNWSLSTPGITVCPTDRMAEYLSAQGISPDRLTVMHHWSDSEEIRPVVAIDNKLRDEWGLQNAFVVGYSGNFGRAHEFDTLIDAARRLRHRKDIYFLLIGGGNQHASVIAAAHRFKLDRMVFKPLQPVSDLAQSLSVADVHVVSLLPELEHCIVPSKFYGILAAGRPTVFIGDPNGEVARVIAAKGCGASVKIGAVDELAALIEELRKNPDVCTTMGKTARKLMLSEYSRENSTDAWCSLLTRLHGARQLTTPMARSATR